MADRSYTTSDLSRKSGDIIAEALRHPVTITQRGKPRLVIMSIEAYEKLTREAADTRRVFSLRELDITQEELERALAEYEAQPETDEQ